MMVVEPHEPQVRGLSSAAPRVLEYNPEAVSRRPGAVIRPELGARTYHNVTTY